MNRNSRCCPRWYKTQNSVKKQAGSSGSGSVHFSGGRRRPSGRPSSVSRVGRLRSGARAPGAHAAPSPPPRSLTSVLSSLGRPCARAARCADALAVVLNSSRHRVRSVIVDRSIGVCSCVVGAGRENLEWNFYTPRSFDGPHRSIFDLSIGILQKFVCGVRVAREIYTVHRPQNSFVLRKNDPVNKKRFRVGWRRGEPKQQHRSSWRRTGQVNQEAEVCEP